LKLPSARPRPANLGKAKDNSVYVKGESPINYDDLAKPEVKQKKHLWLYVAALVVLAIIGGAYYYFFFLHNGAH